MNLVITAAWGKHAATPGFRVFLNSFKENAFNCALAVVIHPNTPKEIKDHIRASSAKPIIAETAERLDDEGNKNRHLTFAQILFDIYSAEYAMTVDARDTVVQADPFHPVLSLKCGHMGRAQIAVSEEWPSIGECDWNTKDFRSLLPDLRASVPRPSHWPSSRIINGGFATGTIQNMAWFEYARWLVDAREGEATDQASLKLIAHNAPCNSVLAVRPFNPWVLHAHWLRIPSCNDSYHWDGRYVRMVAPGTELHNEKVALIHQWDRSGIADQIQARYGVT